MNYVKHKTGTPAAETFPTQAKSRCITQIHSRSSDDVVIGEVHREKTRNLQQLSSRWNRLVRNREGVP
jgi:hypothetical protein